MSHESTDDSERPDLKAELDFGRQFIKLLLDGTTPEKTPLRILTALYTVGYYAGALSPLINEGVKQALLLCVADGMADGMRFRRPDHAGDAPLLRSH